MAPLTLTSVFTPDHTGSRHARSGSLSLRSPVSPSSTQGGDKPASSLAQTALAMQTEEDPHAFRPPTPTASRSPCPALNALANHGYLPRDGRNITSEALHSALQHPDTYHVSPALGEVLARGGPMWMGKGPHLSLHDLAEHNRIEHNCSIVHKNVAPGKKYAPIRTDTLLLESFFEEKEFITLDDVAKRKFLLEKSSKLDALHAEISRGEWALVLDIFGRAHGGRVPVELIRDWLKENRLPEGWKPTHEQGLMDTVAISRKIAKKMKEYAALPETEEDRILVNTLAQQVQTAD